MDPILQWLPLLIDLITQGKALVDTITNNLKQNTELTPEQQAARDALIAQKEASPAWQVQS